MNIDDLPDFDEITKILKKGQTWLPYNPNDYSIEILDLNETTATVKYLETGDIDEFEMDGSDCFPDYLESNLYYLKYKNS